MKNKKMKSVLIAIMLFITSYGQNEFPIGGFIGNPQKRYDSSVYDSITALGYNTVIQYSAPGNQSYLQNFNLFAQNEDNNLEKISYYARGYLKKWEAEENNTNTLSTGIHHKYGTAEMYAGRNCWKVTDGDGRDSLIFGPSYRQDKKYRLSYYNDVIPYTVKFVLALKEIELEEDVPICRVSVIYKYREISNGDSTIQADTFATSEVMYSELATFSFKEIGLNYSYPSQFTNALYSYLGNMNPPVDSVISDDEYPGMGITFQIDWYGVGDLFVDYIQVYDQEIGDKLRNEFERVDSLVRDYDSTFSGTGWSNLTKWYAADEPQTIDQYEPMRLVDSILRTKNRGLITEFIALTHK